MVLAPQLGSNTQNQFHTKTEQSIGLTTSTINAMIPLQDKVVANKTIYISLMEVAEANEANARS